MGERFEVFMDKFWSICTMPIGVLICFGPALLVWVVQEAKAQAEEKKKKKGR